MNPPVATELPPELGLPVLNVGQLADLIGLREAYHQARCPRTAAALDALITDLRKAARVR